MVQESGCSPPNTETHPRKEPCLSPRAGHPVFGKPPAVGERLALPRLPGEPPLRPGRRPCSLRARREQTGKEGPCHPELSLHPGRQFRPREQVARATKRVRCREPPGAARARGRAEGLGELRKQPEKGPRPTAQGAQTLRRGRARDCPPAATAGGDAAPGEGCGQEGQRAQSSDTAGRGLGPAGSAGGGNGAGPHPGSRTAPRPATAREGPLENRAGWTPLLQMWLVP